MHSVFKIMAFILIINTFFILGGVSNVGGSILSSAFRVNITDSGELFVSGLGDDLSSSLPTGASSSGFETGSTGLNFIDALKTLGAFFFGFMISTLLAPINLLVGVGFNPILVLLIGVPITALYIGSWVAIVRGVN